MPRGFKRDEAATLAARFEDYRSFMSQPKIIKGECIEPKAHLVLYGFEDKAKVRQEVFRCNREKYEGVNRCVECLRRVIEGAQEGNVWRGEWDHIRNKAGERCDCPENGQILCRECHYRKHPHIMSGKVAT